MATSSEDEEEMKFLSEKHKLYCMRTLQILPGICESYDSTRLVIAFFAVSALDLLNSLSKIENQKSELVDWIYHLQVVPDEKEYSKERCGFRGSAPCTVFSPNVHCTEHFDRPHIAMTYAALALLLILEDDLSRVERKAIIHSLKKLQLDDGSFRSIYDGSENDMRFVYCACCISYILNDWTGVDIKKACDYILKSITYEGGIAQGPLLEAHGGSTFCAVASLWLMNQLSILSESQLSHLRRWCLMRHAGGFQGRPNKLSDTCYTFWVGSTLKLLNSYHFVHHQALRKYVFSAQDPVLGGISRLSDNIPDPLHTYLAIGGLSLMQCDDIKPVHPALNISERAVEHLSRLHKAWSVEQA